MECPNCGHKLNVGKMMGSLRSDRKAESSRQNGKLGGRHKSSEKEMGGNENNAPHISEPKESKDFLSLEGVRCVGGVHCPMTPVVKKDGKWFCELHSIKKG